MEPGLERLRVAGIPVDLAPNGDVYCDGAKIGSVFATPYGDYQMWKSSLGRRSYCSRSLAIEELLYIAEVIT